MDQRAKREALAEASLDVHMGLLAGGGIVVLRALALAALLSGDGPADWSVVVQVLVQLVLAAVFSYGLYRRQLWAAVGLLVVWGVGFFYSWIAMGRMVPPLGLIGILIWYGLYRGFRGVRLLAAHAKTPVAAA